MTSKMCWLNIGQAEIWYDGSMTGQRQKKSIGWYVYWIVKNLIWIIYVVYKYKFRQCQLIDVVYKQSI